MDVHVDQAWQHGRCPEIDLACARRRMARDGRGGTDFLDVFAANEDGLIAQHPPVATSIKRPALMTSTAAACVIGAVAPSALADRSTQDKHDPGKSIFRIIQSSRVNSRSRRA
jgi:hypothetical protein